MNQLKEQLEQANAKIAKLEQSIEQLQDALEKQAKLISSQETETTNLLDKHNTKVNHDNMFKKNVLDRIRKVEHHAASCKDFPRAEIDAWLVQALSDLQKAHRSQIEIQRSQTELGDSLIQLKDALTQLCPK